MSYNSIWIRHHAVVETIKLFIIRVCRIFIPRSLFSFALEIKFQILYHAFVMDRIQYWINEDTRASLLLCRLWPLVLYTIAIQFLLLCCFGNAHIFPSYFADVWEPAFNNKRNDKRHSIAFINGIYLSVLLQYPSLEFIYTLHYQWRQWRIVFICWIKREILLEKSVRQTVGTETGVRPTMKFVFFFCFGTSFICIYI